MRSLLLIGGGSRTEDGPVEADPAFRLGAHGYRISQAADPQQVKAAVATVDAAVICAPAPDIPYWSRTLHECASLPLFWWCGESGAEHPREAFEQAGSRADEAVIDGLLTSGMSALQLHWALHWGARRFHERAGWSRERRQLLEKIEGRKWVDAAKRIIGETKQATEAEAYNMLRKQAMDERRTIVEVAESVVKVYELLLQEPSSKETRPS